MSGHAWLEGTQGPPSSITSCWRQSPSPALCTAPWLGRPAHSTPSPSLALTCAHSPPSHHGLPGRSPRSLWPPGLRVT